MCETVGGWGCETVGVFGTGSLSLCGVIISPTGLTAMAQLLIFQDNDTILQFQFAPLRPLPPAIFLVFMVK